MVFRHTLKSMLKDVSISSFRDKISSQNEAVGGGSAAALTGVLAAELLKMSLNHSLAAPALDGQEKLFQNNLKRLDYLSVKLGRLVEKDALVLKNLLEVLSDAPFAEVDILRQNEMASALENAARVPLETASFCLAVLEIGYSIALIVEDNLQSELMTAIICGHAGATGALMSTAANLPHLKDENLAADLQKEIKTVLAKADELKRKIECVIFKKYPFTVFLENN